jgi:hypothetical protein
VAAFSFDFAVGVVSLAPKLDADAAMATSATIAIPTIPVRIVWCRVPEFIVVSLEIAARPATGCLNYTRKKDRQSGENIDLDQKISIQLTPWDRRTEVGGIPAAARPSPATTTAAASAAATNVFISRI